MSGGDILNLIDSAVRDWETSPDAVRYNGPKPAETPVGTGVSLAASTGLTFAEACANLSANLEALRSRLSASSSPYAAADATLVIGDREVPVTDFRLEANWRRPQPVALSAIGMASEFEQQMLALTQGERDEFVAYWQAGPLGFEQAFYAWRMRRMMEPIRVSLSAWAEQLVAALRGAQASMGAFSHTLRLDPWPHGLVEPCFCHPAPFPAARDYRRRTKHRNRRRR